MNMCTSTFQSSNCQL